MTAEPQRYTLTEAQRELARRDCSTHGHTYDALVNAANEPIVFICSRCYRRWSVQREGGQDHTDA